MCVFPIPQEVSSGGTSTVGRLISCACPHVQNRAACAHWSEGDSGLVGGPWHTVGVFALDNIQSFPTKSALDHFSLNLTCLGCSVMGKGL